ncbi:tetratricopeptide repeat-containing protein [Mucilaginibacter sp.]|uniref:tetratricopeptide repeat-containing protein n=1 Tax=Mucilaginibacter sp. TaxID=1882438 RepID=UPI0025F34F56|nr:tetratricopeptide repeat-containing protein [Mucilaginibacter sp.]
MPKELCFVIMGFGKKKDPDSNRTIDLDETYKKIIKPAVIACNYNCVRADEITDSGLIDRSMFALLMNAELVIADITTYNPNAIYELGVRHAVRPYSTIIIKEEGGNIPFDFNHNRTLTYKHLGSEISASEAKRCIRDLKNLINTVTQSPLIDSPMYSFIPKVQRPLLSEEDFAEIIGELRNKENTIYSLMESAKDFMAEKKFTEAALKWKKLSELVDNDLFFIQQYALCVYKSKSPTQLVALTNALNIMERIKPFNDAESLGIAGAINKNLWKETQELAFLNIAIENYKKGWNLFTDYYTGENYAHCLEQKALRENEVNLKNYYRVEAQLTRQCIIDIVLPMLSVPKDELEDIMWRSATLSNCYLALGDTENANIFEKKFLAASPVSWEIDTFTTSKNELIELSCQ